jgi:phenylalanyl-tRNA synthetase beta chain
MRMSMLYSGLETVQYNRNRRETDLKLYEFGYTYTFEKGKYTEVPHFALFMCGMKENESWNTPQKAINYFTLKSVLLNVLSKTGITKLTFDYKEEDSLFNNYTSISSEGKVLVEFGTVNDTIASKFDIEEAIYYADIKWKNVLDLSSKNKFALQPVSSFPNVRRDLALLLDKAVRYSEIERIAVKAEPKLLKAINAFDVYEGDKIESGKKSYAISFILQDEQKTLTDHDIETVMNKLIKQFEKELGAVLRG